MIEFVGIVHIRIVRRLGNDFQGQRFILSPFLIVGRYFSRRVAFPIGELNVKFQGMVGLVRLNSNVDFPHDGHNFRFGIRFQCFQHVLLAFRCR